MLLRLTHVTEHHQPAEMADPQPTSTTIPGELLTSYFGDDSFVYRARPTVG